MRSIPQCWRGTMQKEMVRANLVIVEISCYVILFENEDVIWYHDGRPFYQGLKLTKRAAHSDRYAALISFHWNSFRTCVHAPARRWCVDVMHGSLLYI